MRIRLIVANQDHELEDVKLTEEEELSVFRKSPGDSLVLRDRLYSVKSITLSKDASEIAFALDLLGDPEWIVSKRGTIIHRNFNDGDRVRIFQASGPENAKFIGSSGTVESEDTPNLPVEKRKIGDFHFTTIVKVRLEDGREVSVPDTILEKID